MIKNSIMEHVLVNPISESKTPLGALDQKLEEPRKGIALGQKIVRNTIVVYRIEVSLVLVRALGIPNIQAIPPFRTPLFGTHPIVLRPVPSRSININ